MTGKPDKTAPSIPLPLATWSVKAAIAGGYLPAAAAFGVAAVGAHFTPGTAILMSASVFGASSQTAALTLLARHSPLIVIIAMVGLVNFRHIVYGFRLAPKTHRWNPWFRAIFAFGLSDEVFAAAALGPDSLLSGPSIRFALWAYGSWVAGTVAGALLGGVLTMIWLAILSFSLPSMFAGLVGSGNPRLHAAVAAAAGWIAVWIAILLGFPDIGLGAAAVAGWFVGSGDAR